jgi:AcrR family transcriptional regulator
MSVKDPEKTARKPRADALRNRECIVEIARQAFAEGGAAVTLDDIVKRSGLGVGTLYRHFPTRDALIEAVYLSEVERMAEAQRTLSESLPPVEALRQWMLLFVDFLSTKLAMKEALNALVCGTEGLYAASGDMIRAAITELTSRAATAGEIHQQFEPLDLLRAITGIAQTAPGSDWELSAKRFVDVLIAGIRVQS